MRTRSLLAGGVLATALLITGGLAVAAPPDGSDDDIAVAAESALQKWLVDQGATFMGGTIACAVDSLSSKSVYCYAHTASGIIAVSSPIPAALGGAWQFTLIAGSLGADGNTPIPTNRPQQPPPPPSAAPPPTGTAAPPTSAPSVTTAPSPTPVDPAPPTSAGAPTSTFGEGQQLVNVDVAPGRYQADGSDFCYWERLSAPNQDVDSIIANAIVSGPVVADILSTDVIFGSSGCGTWRPYAPPAAPVTTFGEGSYVVGSDIVPGTYEASGGPDCYWRRMSSFTADSEDLLDIANMTEPGTVLIEATDVGFNSSECGTWTLVNG